MMSRVSGRSVVLFSSVAAAARSRAGAVDIDTAVLLAPDETLSTSGWRPTHLAAPHLAAFERNAAALGAALRSSAFRRLLLPAEVDSMDRALARHPSVDLIDPMRDGDATAGAEDPLVATIRWLLRLGYRRIGLVGHPAAGGWTSRTATQWQQLRRDLLRRGSAAEGAELYALGKGQDADDVLNLPRLSLAAFVDAPALGAVIVPITPREVPRAVDGLALWDRPDRLPFQSAAGHPVVLGYSFNCAPDPALEARLREGFERTEFLRHQFSDLAVHFCNLPPEKDRYIREPVGDPPKFGFKSGPNFLFLETMRWARRFGGFVFQMETDCTPLTAGWLAELDRLARQNRECWVIGSQYRGAGILERSILRHLNGNALYHAGNPEYIRFLEDVYFPWLLEYIETVDANVAYDVGWEVMIHSKAMDVPDHDNWRLVQHLGERFRACGQIVNIAGLHELQGHVGWNAGTIRRSFPSAVVVHGPMSDDPGTPDLWMLPLATIGVCSLQSDGWIDMAGDIFSDVAYTFIGPFDGSLSRGQRIRLRLSGRISSQARLQFGIQAGHGEVYEGTIGHQACDDSFDVTIEHTLRRRRFRLRVILGLFPGEQPTKLWLDMLEVCVLHDAGEEVCAGPVRIERPPSALSSAQGNAACGVTAVTTADMS